MKVSFSASYFEIPVVQQILLSCDQVFSTNVTREADIRAILGDKLKMERRTTDDDQVFRNQHPDYEFVTFRDLRTAIKNALMAGDQQTAELLLNYCGWSKRPQLLGDEEEGIEGWEYWNRGTNKSITTSDEQIPAEIIASMAKSF
jgi:hypothetical protein